MHLKKMSPRRNIGDPTKHDKEWEAERWCLMVFERQKKKEKKGGNKLQKWKVLLKENQT